MSSNARWWLALISATVLVVAGAVVIVRQVARPDAVPPDSAGPSASAPTSQSAAPPNPSATPSPVTGVRLPGAGDAVMVLQTATGTYQFQLRTGNVTATTTPRLEQFSSFIAGRGWVIFKTVDDDTGVLVDSEGAAHPLPAALRTNGRLVLTSHNDVWLVPEDPTRGYRTIVRYGIDGHRVGAATIRLPDELATDWSDQAGHLLITTATAGYRADPSGVHQVSTGTVLGLNADRVLSWDCDTRARCDPYLVDRTTGHRTHRPDLHDALRHVYRGRADRRSHQHAGAPQPRRQPPRPRRTGMGSGPTMAPGRSEPDNREGHRAPGFTHRHQRERPVRLDDQRPLPARPDRRHRQSLRRPNREDHQLPSRPPSRAAAPRRRRTVRRLVVCLPLL